MDINTGVHAGLVAVAAIGLYGWLGLRLTLRPPFYRWTEPGGVFGWFFGHYVATIERRRKVTPTLVFNGYDRLVNGPDRKGPDGRDEMTRRFQIRYSFVILIAALWMAFG